MTNILILSGSPSVISRSSAIANYLKRSLVKEGHQVSELTIRELPAEALLHAHFKDPVIQAAQKLVEKADSIIVVSPVYKASYPGLLKSFFDLIPEKGLTDKKVLSIATGGTIAHLLSLEYAFKPLFSVLGAKEIPQGVYIVDSQFSYSGDKLTFLDPEIEERLLDAVQEFVGPLQKNRA